MKDSNKRGISVAIIMRDEEAVIERCLRCVQAFGAEIIVSDTGSTDRSMELAKKYTPHVYRSEKYNSSTHYSEFEFGVARNEALRRCTKPWVVWWDADDVTDDNGAEAIRCIAENEPQDSLYTFSVVYGASRFEHCRMLPNGKGVFFDETHGCHEYVLTQGLPKVRRHDIVIEHSPVKKGVPSAVRNLAILEKDFFERNRTDQRTVFYLASAYRENFRHEDAVEYYDKYLAMSQWSEERLFARMYKSKCLTALGKWKDARDELMWALCEDDRYADVYCALGDMYMDRRRYDLAMRWYNMAYGLKVPADSILFVHPAKYREYPRLRIQECVQRMSVGEIGTDGMKLMKDISVKMGRSLSDGLIASAAIGLYFQRHESSRVTLYATERQASLLGAFKRLEVLTEPAPGDGVLALEVPGDTKGRARRHDIDWYARCMGVVPENGAGAFPMVGIKKNAVEAIGDDFRDCVLFHVRPDFEGGWWGENQWSLLAGRLRAKGFRIAQVGKKLDALSGVDMLVNEDGDAELVKASILGCSFVVCVDGWVHHLAAGFGKMAVVIWGSTSHENRGYMNQINISNPSVDCRPCWGEWAKAIGQSRCKRNGECMSALTADMVFEIIEREILSKASRVEEDGVEPELVKK